MLKTVRATEETSIMVSLPLLLLPSLFLSTTLGYLHLDLVHAQIPHIWGYRSEHEYILM